MNKKNEDCVLIEGAMDVETDYIIARLDDKETVTIGKWLFVSGRYQNRKIVTVATHWGMANAAAVTALAAERFAPCAVISQGTAGGHDPALKNYDIVIATKTVNESAWKTEYAAKGEGADYRALKKLGVFAYDKLQKKFTQEVYHATDEKLFRAATEAGKNYRRGKIVSGIIGTADSWNVQADRILFLREFYGSLCEEMEGDAVAQICQTYDIPFIDIRIISNTVFDGDVDWDTASGEACQELVLNTIINYF